MNNGAAIKKLVMGGRVHIWRRGIFQNRPVVEYSSLYFPYKHVCDLSETGLCDLWRKLITNYIIQQRIHCPPPPPLPPPPHLSQIPFIEKNSNTTMPENKRRTIRKIMVCVCGGGGGGWWEFSIYRIFFHSMLIFSLVTRPCMIFLKICFTPSPHHFSNGPFLSLHKRTCG